MAELQAIEAAGELASDLRNLFAREVKPDSQHFPLPGKGQAPGQPATLEESWAMLELAAGERRAVDEQLEKARRELKRAAEALDGAAAIVRDLAAHDRRATSALSDVLATFLPDDKGWTRSVSVTMEDFAGWQGAAQPWEGTSAS